MASGQETATPRGHAEKGARLHPCAATRGQATGKKGICGEGQYIAHTLEGVRLVPGDIPRLRWGVCELPQGGPCGWYQSMPGVQPLLPGLRNCVPTLYELNFV